MIVFVLYFCIKYKGVRNNHINKTKWPNILSLLFFFFFLNRTVISVKLDYKLL